MNDYTTLQIGIDYPSKEIDDFNVSALNLFNIKLPTGKRDIEKEFRKICNDHKQLGELLSNQQDVMKEILDDVLSGRQNSAILKAKSIGLTEASFKTNGGGLIGWLVVAVVVAILLYPSDAK